MRYLSPAIIAASAAITLAGMSTANANLVQNGSLEDLSGSFSNTAANYQQLFAGSTAIAGWTVGPATINDIAWAKSPTGDGHNAADGIFFVDLSGFGANSPNGSLQQTLTGLVVGQSYSFSLASEGALPLVTIGGAAVALSGGVPFTVGSDIWTPETGSFVAGSSNPMLSVMNNTPGQQIVFIDNIVITGPTAAIPEPANFALLAIGVAGICVVRRRKAAAG